MTRHARGVRCGLGCSLLAATMLLGCTDRDTGIKSKGSFKVVVTLVDGQPLPTKEAPLPANLADVVEQWDFTAQAVDENGDINTDFDGYARVSMVPGSVAAVTGGDSFGRNVKFVAGQATGSAEVTAMFGATRLWVEDIGYTPAPDGVQPICANGIDDDGNVAVDHPNDPGCAFADDMTEEAGTLTTGVSQAVYYLRPTLADVQGRGSETPYRAVSVEVKTNEPNYVVVTRVASAGFFVTDIGEPGGYNHMFAFNFNTPEGMRVCDRLSFLTGTAAEFFGFTELNFPSYEVDPVFEGEACLVPEPTVLTDDLIDNDSELEKLESGLVRIEGYTIPNNFGPELAENNVFAANASNCDLNGDGTVDFLSDAEGSCANVCAADPDCTEWVSFASRGNYKVSKGSRQIQVNTGTAFGFDPTANKGETIAALSGTLRNFSGGSLNWTIETRCIDDLVCDKSVDEACTAEPVPSTEACVTLRTEFDNDAGTN